MEIGSAEFENRKTVDFRLLNKGSKYRSKNCEAIFIPAKIA